MSYKNRTKILLSLFFASLILVPQAAFADFADVPTDHPYYEAITALEDAGLVEGYDNNMFRPDELVTKAEFFALVFRHAGYDPRPKLYETPYLDVPSGAWFAPFVKKARELKLIDYTPNLPKFFPTGPVSRIDAMKLILPLEGVPAPLNDSSTDVVFEDIQEDSPFIHYVKAAQNSGIFLPEEEPYFHPLKNLTRGETAELLFRAQIYREVVGDPLEVPPAPFIDSVDFSTGSPDLINNPKFPILLSVWTKINSESLYKENIDPDELVYGAIDGMVGRLEDEHALFQSPSDSATTFENLDGSYEGIGTVIDSFEDEFLIINVMKGSPAEEAGLEAGDVILEVDGEDVSDYTIMELINSIKGPSGTTVSITVRRNDQKRTFEVERGQIALDTVFFEGGFEVPGDIGYIAIYQFTTYTADDFHELLGETLANDPKGLIIDLRDNPGGYVDAAYEVLDLFIPQGETLVKMRFNGQLRDTASNGPGDASKEIPLVLLVNENTASAAELVAGALQDHGLARLVGEQTYGKGTVQEVNTYTDGSLFKFSIAEWLTPLNNKIDQVGLTPDVVVKRTKDDVLGKSDTQLERAIEELRKMI